MTEPLTRNCHHPQLFTLPARAAATRRQPLDIRVPAMRCDSVASRQRAGGLSALDDRPASATRRSVRRATLFWNVTLPLTVAGTLLLLGGVMMRARLR